MPSSTASTTSISSIAQSFVQTKEQLVHIEKKRGGLYIGIPRESTLQENRVALIPSSVATLTARGHRVIIETGAGEPANFSDHEYSEAGAEIAYSPEKVYAAEVILKVAPPTLDEIELCHANQIIISPLQAPIITEEYINKMRQKRVIALAMEYIKDEVGSFPIVRIMAEIAGLSAMLTAAELLSASRGGIGVLLGGISGVPPAKVVILGAGVVAEFATRVALGLGAEVRIFDNNIYKLMRLQNQVGRQLYTSAIDPSVLTRELMSADAVIGAIHSGKGRAPMIVTDDMVQKMRPGSVIIDVSIDQGGCFETSRVTTHDKPTFRHHDVIHYCVPNIASRVPRTASNAISHIMTPILLRSEQFNGIHNLLIQSPGLLNGIYAYKGSLTNRYLSERFNMRFTSIELLIPGNI
ncbi:MAG: alanine dehydrogenase [Saprospiraceae bacterium]|nr:alanine dehydrogenase [Saprospiraceae bacterium]